MKTIVFITTGQPSTNPRLIKEYTALKNDGYQIKVIYSYWVDWALKTDEDFFETGKLNKEDFLLAGGSPYKNRHIYLFTRFVHKFCKAIAPYVPSFTKWSIARPSYALYIKAISTYADLYIAHNIGALPAAWLAAKKYKTKIGFDAEDYHRGEFFNPNSFEAKAVKYAEDKYLPHCDYITAASPLIGKAYQKLYPSKAIIVINNVFSRKYLQKISKENNDNLRLFWFSQTIGPNRGLETAVKAIEILKEKCRIELYLMGNISDAYSSKFLKATTQPDFIHFIEPVSPDKIFEEAAKFDIGLALEVPETENRDYCLTNKLFTYLLAGNCIILSDTKAQKDFFNTYSGIGYIFNAGSESQLSEILLHVYNNKDELYNKKLCSLRIASQHLNWENDSDKFRQIIKRLLQCKEI